MLKTILLGVSLLCVAPFADNIALALATVALAITLGIDSIKYFKR